MSSIDRETIGQALCLLSQGLYPYVEEKMRSVYGNAWLSQAKSVLSNKVLPKQHLEDGAIEKKLQEDISLLLKVIHQRWEKAFKPHLSQAERTLVNELIEIRNQWAHSNSPSTEDTYRALDSISRLLTAIGATEAQDVTRKKQEVLQRLSQEANRKNRDGTTSAKENRLREQFQDLLNLIPFQDVLLLDRALTHRSYVYENPTLTEGDNEQLEFLGDIVLEFLAGTFVYQENPGCKEGELSDRKSRLVDNSQLAKFASQFDLGKWIRLGKGEESQGGRQKSSLLSNTFEAILGAYYLDSGIEAVRQIVEPLLQSIAEEEMIPHSTVIPVIYSNPKGSLQEYAQKQGYKIPIYSIIAESGADHTKEFTIAVEIGGNVYGTGSGKSKKEAEKNAALDALGKLK